MDHHDLMKRINESINESPKIIKEMDDPGKSWKDDDRRKGYRRYEFLVEVPGLIRKIKKLFRRA